MEIHKAVARSEQVTVFHADLWGLREPKCKALWQSEFALTDWHELDPRTPYYLFAPWDVTLQSEYERGWKVTDIFPLNGVGMTTARDGFVIDHDREKLTERVKAFRDSRAGDDELHTNFGINRKKGWNIRKAWRMLHKISDRGLQEITVPVLYRPFDLRWICWHDAIVWRTVKRVMRHMLAGENVGLIARRRMLPTHAPTYFLCSKRLVSDGAIRTDNYGSESVFPLYLYPDPEGKDRKLFQDLHWPAAQGGRVPNLNPKFVEEFKAKLELQFVSDGKGNLQKNFGPEDIFHYMYALFHSPTYRKRYAEFLKIDFPRLPITSDRELFARLTGLGEQLVEMHLLESPALEALETTYPKSGSNEVEKVRYDESHQRVFINKEQYFEPIAPEVWNFYVGGYQVCRKWLKDRRKRKLSYEDITHYRKIVKALSETIRLMQEIDTAIPAWPVG